MHDPSILSPVLNAHRIPLFSKISATSNHIMIISRVALAFALAVAAPASFADASPLRFHRRLGELQDEADLVDGAVQADQELQDGAVLLIDPVELESHSKNTCKSGETELTCDTDYEKIDTGLTATDASTACGLLGEGWDVCTLEQMCPSNNGTATAPSLPAPGLIEKYGTFLFPGDTYVPFLSTDAGCTGEGSVQLGTGDFDNNAGTCMVYTGETRRRLQEACGEAENGGVICCGCEKTRGVTVPYVKYPPEAPEHTYDCPGAPTPAPVGTPVPM